MILKKMVVLVIWGTGIVCNVQLDGALLVLYK